MSCADSDLRYKSIEELRRLLACKSTRNRNAIAKVLRQREGQAHRQERIMRQQEKRVCPA